MLRGLLPGCAPRARDKEGGFGTLCVSKAFPAGCGCRGWARWALRPPLMLHRPPRGSVTACSSAVKCPGPVCSVTELPEYGG